MKNKALLGCAGAFIGSQVAGFVIFLVSRALPHIASGKAFGWEGAEAMLLIPICLAIVGVGAAAGALLGIWLANRWR